MKASPQERALLHNLAIRARKARQAYNQCRQSGTSGFMANFYEGAEQEAWNSFQAAKQIVFGKSKGTIYYEIMEL